MHINAHKAGLALGGLLGVAHAAWSLLVALGWGQQLLDFVFRLHMIEPVYTVSPFSLVTAASLVAMTAVMGYVLGQVFARLWNYFH